MALSFTTGQTVISAADSATNWAAVRFAGSGQAPAASLDTTVLREGTGSIGAKLAGNNWNAATVFDWYASTEGGKSANTTVDLTASGSEIIAMWVQNTTPGVALTQAADGFYIMISSSADSGTTAPTVYSEWTVGGSDAPTNGWKLYLLDTRKTPTQTVGGGASLSAVRRIGFGVRSVASVGTVKADNVFVDAMWYKTPIYTLSGDGTTTATWDAFLQDSITNENGLVEDVGGTIQISCGIQFGTAAQSSTTTFLDNTGTIITFKRHTYENGTSVVDALNYEDIYTISAAGNGATTTSVTLGQVVGTGDGRQGLLGGSIQGADPNVHWGADFQTDISDLAVVRMYGAVFKGARDGMLFDGKPTPADSSLIGCSFLGCGEVSLGPNNNGAEMLACSVIDPDDFVSSANRGVLLPMSPVSTVITHQMKNMAFITSGTPTTQHMVHFNQTGDNSVAAVDWQFFGSYASATLWHGENSGNGADLTINASGSTNSSTAEWDETGTSTPDPPSTTVVASVALTITVTNQEGNVLSGINCRYEESDGTLISQGSTNGSGVFSFSIDVSLLPLNNALIIVRNKAFEDFSQKINITTAGFDIPVTLQPDPDVDLP